MLTVKVLRKLRQEDEGMWSLIQNIEKKIEKGGRKEWVKGFSNI